MTDTLTIDVEDLTAADLAFVEEYSGKSFTELTEGNPPMRVVIALVYVAMRKDRPDLTIADVEGMKLSALQDFLGNSDARELNPS